MEDLVFSSEEIVDNTDMHWAANSEAPVWTWPEPSRLLIAAALLIPDQTERQEIIFRLPRLQTIAETRRWIRDLNNSQTTFRFKYNQCRTKQDATKLLCDYNAIEP